MSRSSVTSSSACFSAQQHASKRRPSNSTASHCLASACLGGCTTRPSTPVSRISRISRRSARRPRLAVEARSAPHRRHPSRGRRHRRTSPTWTASRGPSRLARQPRLPWREAGAAGTARSPLQRSSETLSRPPASHRGAPHRISSGATTSTETTGQRPCRPGTKLPSPCSATALVWLSDSCAMPRPCASRPTPPSLATPPSSASQSRSSSVARLRRQPTPAPARRGRRARRRPRPPRRSLGPVGCIALSGGRKARPGVATELRGLSSPPARQRPDSAVPFGESRVRCSERLEQFVDRPFELVHPEPVDRHRLDYEPRPSSRV